jgi:hypothetical protein
MNKTELLKDLQGKTFIDYIGEPEKMEEKPDGSIWYRVNVREVDGDCATYKNIDFYVVDEGNEGETAYYKDKPVEQSVKAEETA